MSRKKVCGNADVEAYLKSVENDKPLACADQHKLAALVRKAFAKGDIYVDEKQYQAYLKIGEAMFPTVMPWEKFLMVLENCTYWKKDNRPRWNHSIVLMARGAGKDGWISWEGLSLTSKNNPVPDYDIDICANNQDQSIRPVKDAIKFLNNPKYRVANESSFYWTTEYVRGLNNGGTIKGHTNNPKGKDGLRSGKIILNEFHAYEDYANINVFTTGLGKKACPRSEYIGSNGNIREGVLDRELAVAEAILNGEMEDGGTLPFICRLDSKDEVYDEANWVKANPSLPYMPDLLDETRKEFVRWKEDPATLPDFMSKRMNMPDIAGAHAVTEYDNIKATNQPLPDMTGWQCVVGIDTARTTDFESVNALFKRDGKYYCINHTWVCLRSKDLGRVKFRSEFPKLVDMGLLTLVDDVEINSSYVTDYIQQLKEKYQVKMVCIDDFRYSLFSNALSQIGFHKDFKNLKMVRPSDIARVVPLIESLFLSHAFVWGDNPMLRWATNNTKVVPWKVKTVNNADLGNQLYAKIEPKSRKTDPFMALVHSMTAEGELTDSEPLNDDIFKVYSF